MTFHVLILSLGLLTGAPPQSPEPFQLFGEGKVAEAYAAAGYRVVEHRATPRDFLVRGLVERSADTLEAAVKSFSRGLELDPNDLSLRLELATTLAWSRQFERALEQYETALGQAPDHRGALLGWIRTLLWAGELRDGEAEISRLLEPDPEDPEVLCLRALLETSRQSFEQARATYRRILELSPNHPEATEALERLRGVYRTSLTISGGWETEAQDGPGEEATALVLRHQLTRRVGAFFELRSESRERLAELANFESPTRGPHRSSLLIGATLRPGGRFGLGLSYLSQLDGGGEKAVREALAEVSFRLHERASLFGGLRPRWEGSASPEILAFIGLRVLPIDGLAVSVQRFESRGDPAWFLSAEVQSGRRWRGKLGAGTSETEGRKYENLVAEVSLAAGPRLEIGLRHATLSGSADRSSWDLSLTRKW